MKRAFVLLVLILMVACSDPTDAPETLIVSPTSITFNSLRAVQMVQARDARGRSIDPRVLRWSSSDGRVAFVSELGGVLATGNGVAAIRVTASPTLYVDIPVSVDQQVRGLGQISSHHQTGAVTDTLPEPLVVEIQDSLGAAIRGHLPATVVTFTTGNGSVVPSAVTVDSNGRASARWILGTVAGESSADASLIPGIPGMSFFATVRPGPATTMTRFYGFDQTGLEYAPLQYGITVRLADRFDNNVSGYPVHFAVTSGGGTVSASPVLTDEYGRATTHWTLGGVGPQTLDAVGSSPPLAGAPVTFMAEAVAYYVTGVAPDSIQEGHDATILGGGFDTVLANNAVTIGGMPARVVAATRNALSVVVPDLGCDPSPTASVFVTVAGQESNRIFPPVKPVNPVEIAVGQQLILPEASPHCLHFAATSSPSRYLVGVQSMSEDPAHVTAARARGRTWFPIAGMASAAAPARVLRAPSGQTPSVLETEMARRWSRHREAEARFRERDLLMTRQLGTAMALRSSTQALLDSTRQVGDTIRQLRVWSGEGGCEAYREITAVVRARGRSAYWLEDVANPGDGRYSAQDLDSLSRFFDGSIFRTDTSYFGPPGDTDANRRVVVLITKEVNRLGPGLLGFVLSCDFFPRAQAATSNEGEFFYARAPDPTGFYGWVYTRADAVVDAPLLVAHELTHIIQLSRRIPAGSERTSWLLEGQATFAEEVNGFAAAGRQPGANYGLDVAFNSPETSPYYWYVGMFVDLALYFGFESSTTRRPGAPHECTWIGSRAQGNTGPCVAGREVYGVPASFLRWLSDRLRSEYPGGERGLHKAIINNPNGGFLNIASVTGRSVDSLLAQWAAALYVDDRVPGLDPRVSFSSWNLLNIFNGLVETARLVPHDIGFGAAFELTKHVRGGSTAYLQIGGSGRPVTTLRFLSEADEALPPHMNLWVVRIE